MSYVKLNKSTFKTFTERNLSKGNKLEVVKEVKIITKLGLKEAKELVDTDDLKLIMKEIKPAMLKWFYIDIEQNTIIYLPKED